MTPPRSNDALKTAKTFVTDDAESIIDAPDIDVIIEATGDPATGIRLCLAAIEAGKHIIMVNVEADALAGPLLARKAAEKGVVYSLAWGDQPALICEQVDWARACGFEVVSAGKGTRYLPTYHASTPDTVWEILDQYLNIQDRSHVNPKMFNSFIDGTKSGIEMTAVCNATGLNAQKGGLSFPPAPASSAPKSASRKPTAACSKPPASPRSRHPSTATARTCRITSRWAPTSSITSDSDYALACMKEYNCLPDKSGRYGALYRPTHMIGLELGVSVASVALRGEPTGSPIVFNSDVATTAKRNLKAGTILDGEGGACVWGRQTPAADSLKAGYLPLGLASDVKLKRDIAEGDCLTWDDVDIDMNDPAVKFRREMEAAFSRPNVVTRTDSKLAPEQE